MTADLPIARERCGEVVPLGTRVRFMPRRNRIWHFRSECGGSDAAVARKYAIDPQETF